MDSISSYEAGGAAGELLIRFSLENAFRKFGISLDVMNSDSQFESADMKSYDFIILDPWTWAGPGWVPKAQIRKLDSKIYILDFFSL